MTNSTAAPDPTDALDSTAAPDPISRSDAATPPNATLTADGTASTTAAPRYAKQLASHLGRKAEIRTEPEGQRVVFDVGSCLLVPSHDALKLHAEAKNPEGLERVQRVVGSHLERFGQRDGLAVQWGQPVNE